jgi:hypothetical protein
VPYQLARSAGPRIVTALLERLEPCSFVLHPAPEAELIDPYRGFLPQPSGAGSALISMPDPLTGVSSGLAIVGADGVQRWRNAPDEQAQLLPPALDEVAATPAGTLLLRWAGGEPTAPYGDNPALLWLGADGSAPPALLELRPAGQVAGVELLAASPGTALLLIQYNVQSYEFIAISLDPLAISARWSLTGQPLTRSLYPGPGYDYIGLEREGNVVSVAVFEGSLQGVLESWSFDLTAGTQNKAPYLDDLPGPVDALNAADGTAEAVPYPQAILPSAGPDTWSVPAVLDAAGRALIVFFDGSVAWAEPA